MKEIHDVSDEFYFEEGHSEYSKTKIKVISYDIGGGQNNGDSCDNDAMILQKKLNEKNQQNAKMKIQIEHLQIINCDLKRKLQQQTNNELDHSTNNTINNRQCSKRKSNPKKKIADSSTKDGEKSPDDARASSAEPGLGFAPSPRPTDQDHPSPSPTGSSPAVGHLCKFDNASSPMATPAPGQEYHGQPSMAPPPHINKGNYPGGPVPLPRQYQALRIGYRPGSGYRPHGGPRNSYPGDPGGSLGQYPGYPGGPSPNMMAGGKSILPPGAPGPCRTPRHQGPSPTYSSGPPVSSSFPYFGPPSSSPSYQGRYPLGTGPPSSTPFTMANHEGASYTPPHSSDSPVTCNSQAGLASPSVTNSVGDSTATTLSQGFPRTPGGSMGSAAEDGYRDVSSLHGHGGPGSPVGAPPLDKVETTTDGVEVVEPPPQCLGNVGYLKLDLQADDQNGDTTGPCTEGPEDMEKGNQTIKLLQLKLGGQIQITKVVEEINSGGIQVLEEGISGGGDLHYEEELENIEAKRKSLPIDQNISKQDQPPQKNGKPQNTEEKKQHLNTFVNEDPSGRGFMCSICQKWRPKRLEIRRHLESIHFVGIYEYKCNKCMKTFKSENTFLVHNSTVH